MNKPRPPATARDVNRFRARRRKQSAIALTIFVVFGLIVLAIVALAPEDTQQTSTTTPDDFATTITVAPTTTTTVVPVDPSQLSPDGLELLSLVEAGRAARFHAVYTLTGDDLPTNITRAVLEVWRAGSTFRQDSSIVETRGITKRIGIGSATGTVSCQEAPEVPLQCQQVSTEPVDPTDDFVAQALNKLGEAEVTANDQTVSGYPSRCFELESENATQQLCLTAAGVPTLIDTDGLRGEIVTLEDDFDDAVFTPPAQPFSVSTSISTN